MIMHHATAKRLRNWTKATIQVERMAQVHRNIVHRGKKYMFDDTNIKVARHIIYFAPALNDQTGMRLQSKKKPDPSTAS